MRRDHTDDGWVEPQRMTAEIPKAELEALLRLCRPAHPRLKPKALK